MKLPNSNPDGLGTMALSGILPSDKPIAVSELVEDSSKGLSEESTKEINIKHARCHGLIAASVPGGVTRCVGIWPRMS